MSLPFQQITAEKPDYDHLADRCQAIEQQLTSASTSAECHEAVEAWDRLRREYDTWSSLVGLRFEQATNNEQYQQDRTFRDELNPKVQALDTRIRRLLLAPPRRDMLEPLIGQQVFRLWESEVLTFDPIIEQDLVQESKLEAEYTELCGAADIEFRGERYNLSSIGKFSQEADRALRHEAESALWKWFAAQANQLDRIFDELVRLRDTMATKLGFADFVELGYKRMNRIDYAQEDVETFRQQIREHVVPLAAELVRQQAERLGIDQVMFWDEGVYDPRGNPKPQGDHDWMMSRAQEMFDAMPPLGEFFRIMDGGGYLDLKTRDGKAPGGFCTWFASYGMPFIFANFTGTKGDVEVFTHEVGHAFQGYSSRHQPLIDITWPTFESCEIHSMSLEFLTWPHMEKFFGDDAERFRTIHLTQSLLFLPYGVAVDHFQHLVYSRPSASPTERHAMWQEMERMYMPWRAYGDLSYPATGAQWQYKRHIYLAPFYYIDYTLALTCALQFWVRSTAEPDQALRDYVALCARGGEAPFQTLAHDAGLVSPFDEGCLGAVVEQARRML